MFEFAMGHPVATFFIAWVLAHAAVRIVIRCTRSINIAIRGWPPEHLDGDGDFKMKAFHNE